MQIRCKFCQKPFALSRDAVHAALQMITDENLSHFNAPCPHCRKQNRLSKKELQHAAPTWRPETSQES
jgi:hypothetical protein